MSFNPDGSAVCDFCLNQSVPGSPVFAPWAAIPDESDNLPADLIMCCRQCLRAALSLVVALGPSRFTRAEGLVRLNEERWYRLLDSYLAEAGHPIRQGVRRSRESEQLIEQFIRDMEELDCLEDLGVLRATEAVRTEGGEAA